MSEFNNRISAQRDILSVVNSGQWTEELFGLSSGAIERWISANSLDKNTGLVILITEAAEKLFFLSNKSQEQVTEEYKHLSVEVAALTRKIAQALESFRAMPKPSN
jgi:hypothetical protein